MKINNFSERSLYGNTEIRLVIKQKDLSSGKIFYIVENINFNEI
jgi:phosphatidylserine/phosphatidylglycerophosphate/cardiolipin synthase-like enzyme